MSGKPRVSVVTVFHNRGHLVAESVGSLLTQTLSDIEVIVVDDGSTDDTAARLGEIGDDRVRVIHQENMGFTAAIRRAIGECRGGYIAIHGSGDVSLPRRLEAQAACLDEHQDIGLVGCHYTNDGVPILSHRPALERAPMVDTFLKRSRISHGEAMFRKADYDRVGGYRQAFTYAQDRDLWLRMGEGRDYAILPEVLYLRKRLPDGVHQNPHKFYMQRKLSQFAVECALRRRAGKPDLLDRFGPGAFYLSRPTRKLSRLLGNRAMRLFRQGRYDAGAFLAEMSWREWRDPRSAAGLFLAWLARGERRRRLLKLIVRLRRD